MMGRGEGGGQRAHSPHYHPAAFVPPMLPLYLPMLVHTLVLIFHACLYPPHSPHTCSHLFIPSLVLVCTPSYSFVTPTVTLCSFVHPMLICTPTLTLYLVAAVALAVCCCMYTLTGSLVCVCLPCACPSLCGNLPVTG